MAGIGFLIIGTAWLMMPKREHHHDAPDAPQQAEVARAVADKK